MADAKAGNAADARDEDPFAHRAGYGTIGV
jgi:hypothetical protein